MKALSAILAVCICTSAFAEGEDAPVKEEEASTIRIPGGTRAVTPQGRLFLLPDGLFIDKPTAIVLAGTIEGCNEEVKALRHTVETTEAPTNSTLIVIVAIAATILGAAGGASAAYLLTSRP